MANESTSSVPTDPGMLQTLLELLGGVVSPSSAEAAGLSFEQRQELERQKAEQRAQLQMQLLQEKARMQQADQLRQAQTKKLQTQTQQASTPQQSIMNILSGGNQTQDQSGATYFGSKGDFISSSGPNGTPWAPADQFGYSPEKGLYPINQIPTGSNEMVIQALNPETGNPWFGNVMPPWATAQDKASFDRLKASPEYAPKPEVKASIGSQIDPKAIAKHAEIVRTLTKNGYSSTQAGQIADQVVPGMADIAEQAKQKERLQGKKDTADIQRQNLREKFVMENQSNLFKRKTGESFLGLGKPPENTEQILKDYAVLKPENAKDMRSLDMVGGYVDGFRNLMTEIKPLLSSQKRGVVGRLGAGTEIAYLRAKGDARVRKMDALAAQITLLARGFGGDARVSDKEMERLDNSIINGWTTKEGADSTIGILDDFITNRSNSLGFPKYKTLGQRPKTLTPTQEQTVLRNKSKSGLPIISKDNGLTWEYE